MERINLLLGIAERRTGNLIEAAVLDACYERVVVDFTRTSRLSELALWGSRGGFELVLVAAEHLLAEPGRRAGWTCIEETEEALREIRARAKTPIIVLVKSFGFEASLLNAGADVVLPLPFDREALKSEVRRLLCLPEQVEVAEPSRWFSPAALFRGFLG